MSTMYASFVDASAAERAAGALLDNGAIPADVSVVANESYHTLRGKNLQEEAKDAEHDAKSGISTTTGADAAAGAVKGAAAGLGVGIAAALVSMLIPGVGLVLGGGALAAAAIGAAGTTVAGGVAGGVTGWLKDQGVPDEMITHYSKAFLEGGAILAVAVPSGDLTSAEAELLLRKYGALNIATYNSPRNVIGNAVMVEKEPLVVNSPNVDPIARLEATPVVVTPPAQAAVVDEVTGTTTVVTGPHNAMVVDPVTGAERPAMITPPVEGTPIAVDPVTGAAVPVPPASSQVTIDPVTGVATPVDVSQKVITTRTVSADPVSGVVTESATIDPLTGNERPNIVDDTTGVMHPAQIVDPATGHVINVRQPLPTIVVDPVTGVATRTYIDADTGASRTIVVDAQTGLPVGRARLI